MAHGADLRPATAYTLPDRLRPALAAPWGPVVDTATLGAMLRADDVVLSVGDVVSLSLQELGVVPKLFVCDYHTRRGVDDERLRAKLGSWGDREVRVANPAGQLTAQAWDAVRDALQADGTTRIVVDGEEDMLGIPCFLEAPEGAVVVYGMPGQGAVVCQVTPELRQRVADFVQALE